MDLALHLGMSVSALSESMTEREFGLWVVYAGRKGFPFRRMELMLAQLTLWTTRVWGSKEYKLDDFLLDPKKPEPPPSVGAVFGAIGGVRVYKLGQRKKRG